MAGAKNAKTQAANAQNAHAGTGYAVAVEAVPLVSARHAKMKLALDDLASKILEHHGLLHLLARLEHSYTRLTRLLEADAPELGAGYILTRHEDTKHGHWVEARPRGSPSQPHLQQPAPPHFTPPSTKASTTTKKKKRRSNKNAGVNDIVKGVSSLGISSTSASDGEYIELASTLASLNLSQKSEAKAVSASACPPRAKNARVDQLASRFAGLQLLNYQHTHSKLEILQAVFRVLDCPDEDIPLTITQCRRQLQRVHVMIQDVLCALDIELGPLPEIRRPPDGYQIKRYSFWGLRKALRADRRTRFNIHEAKEKELRDLLRPLFRPI